MITDEMISFYQTIRRYATRKRTIEMLIRTFIKKLPPDITENKFRKQLEERF